MRHSSHDLNGPEPQRPGVKLTNLDIAKKDLVEIGVYHLQTEKLKAKDFTDEHPTLMPAYVAAVVYSADLKSLGIGNSIRFRGSTTELG